MVVAARTAPNRSVRFGGEHGALDHRGARDAAELASVAERSAVPVVGPELSVVQTACSMRSEFVVNPDLRSLDVGRWHSMRPDEVPHAELGAWFADPHWDGHGGESVAAFVDRIHDAVDSMSSGASGSSGSWWSPDRWPRRCSAALRRTSSTPRSGLRACTPPCGELSRPGSVVGA